MSDRQNAPLDPGDFGGHLGDYGRANADEAFACERADLLGKRDAAQRIEDARAAVFAAYFAMQDRAIRAERERDAAVRAIEDAQCWLREPLTVKDARNARERLTAYENERLKRAARAKHDAARATAGRADGTR